MDKIINENDRKAMIVFQRNEITESIIYSKLAKLEKGKNNEQILERISAEELQHYFFWKEYTGQEVKPNYIKIFWFYWVSRLLGLTFGIKLMERGEVNAQMIYATMLGKIPESKKVMDDENSHEKDLINMIEEEKLQYVGSIVLGLNDALVELTGALAGLSLALQNTKLIALAGLVTGIAASFSMAASDYLSKKADDSEKNPLRSASYTGLAYILTVAFLVAPYLIFDHYLVCLASTLGIALLIIFTFNYYISVAKDLNFRQRFTEMALISLGVSAITFGIGYLVKKVLGIEV